MFGKNSLPVVDWGGIFVFEAGKAWQTWGMVYTGLPGDLFSPAGSSMPKVKDLTVKELKTVISDTVTESMQDIVEDILALSSEEYLRSIQEARNDYRVGRVKDFRYLG